MADPVPPVEIAPAAVVEAAAPVVVAEAAPAAVEAAPVEAAPAPVEAAPEPVPAAPIDLLKSAVAEGEKPAVEAPPAETPPEGEPEKPAEPATEEPKPVEEAKPIEGEPPAPVRLDPLAEYKYELPAEIKFSDDTQRDSFHTAVEEARNGNVQALVDMHHQTMRQYAEAVGQGQREVWNATLQDWQDKTQNDSQVGGTKFEGVSRRGARLRDNYASTHPHGSTEWKADLNSFNEMLDRTGVGNHPALWRWIDNMAKALGEPAAPAITDPKPAPQGKRGADVMYDNERSPRPNSPN